MKTILSFTSPAAALLFAFALPAYAASGGGALPVTAVAEAQRPLIITAQLAPPPREGSPTVTGANTPASDESAAPAPGALQNITVTFYAWDHLGTTRLVSNSDRTVMERHDHEPFGVELRPIKNQTDNTHQYTGHERDQASGMDYMHARYYGSSLGRFMRPDDGSAQNSGNPQSWNLYSYVKNNPVNFNDPTGHEDEYSFARKQVATIPQLNKDFNKGTQIGTAMGLAFTGVVMMSVAPQAAEPLFTAAKNVAEGNPVEAAKNLIDAAAGAGEKEVGPNAPGDVPDNHTVVRGGQGEMPAPGTTFSGAAGPTPEDAGRGVPHGTVRTATAKDIRDQGGTIQIAPEKSRSGNMNPRHVNVTEGGEKTGFSGPIPNPAPKKERIE